MKLNLMVLNRKFDGKNLKIRRYYEKVSQNIFSRKKQKERKEMQ
jgi:hypothetical protein